LNDKKEIGMENPMNANDRDSLAAIAPLGLAQAASVTEPTEGPMSHLTADFKEVRTGLFEIVRGATACSSTVFYGLLAWANLHAHSPSKAEITTVAGRQGIGPYL
jgi:hypothetical protein